MEAEEESAFAARRVAVKQGEAVGGAEPQGPLAEEQQKDAAKVLQQQSIQLQQIKEALGPDALEVSTEMRNLRKRVDRRKLK